MASTASISTVPSVVISASGSNPPSADGQSSRQAGPLPSKQGEIGFQEGVHDQPLPAGPGASTTSLPERHPDERSAATSTLPTDTPASAPVASGTPSANAPDADSTHSSGKRSFISFLSGKKLPRVLGATTATWTRFLLQLLLLAGTIAAWAIVTMQLHKKGNSASSNSNDVLGTTAPIFIHVAFGIASLAQVLLLERVVFRIRAERYLFRHPGALLPRTMARELAASGSAPHGVLAFAPWNRPPVPTYAAALAENGIRGTGDVEDGLIAQPPPPAYGKTRGSLMLLSGFMNDNLREQARLARTGSLVSHMSQRSDRPISYMSHDSDWDERADAGRARVLEETLSHLQQGETSHRRTSSQDSARTVMPAPPPAAVLPSRGDSLPTIHAA